MENLLLLGVSILKHITVNTCTDNDTVVACFNKYLKPKTFVNSIQSVELGTWNCSTYLAAYKIKAERENLL